MSNNEIQELRAVEVAEYFDFLINGEPLSVERAFSDGEFFNTTMLTVEQPNTFEWLAADNTASITVNGIALENGKCEFSLEEIGEDATIAVQVTQGEITREFEINTLNTHLPPIAVTGASQTPGDFFVSFINTRSIVKTDNEGKILFYRNEDSEDTQYGLWDFKAHQIDGKTYYSYHSTDSHPENTFVFTGHNPGERVILDANYREVARLTAVATQKNAGDTALDGHEFLMLGEEHYIVMSYLQVEADNIPDQNIYTGEPIDHADKAVLVAAYIQEIDHGEVKFEWLSTEHPELYSMTVTEQSDTANQFTNTDPDTYIDYVHLNAIAIDDDGNLVLSCRHLNSMIKVDRVGGTGNLIWALSGHGDVFGLTDNQDTSGQHFLRYHGNGYFSAFNNNNKEGLTNLVMYHLDEDAVALADGDGFQHWVVPGTTEIGASGLVSPHNSIACGAFMQFGDYGVASWGWNISGTELVTEFSLGDASQINFQLTSNYDAGGAYATYRGVKCLSAAPELEFTQQSANWSEINASSGYVLSIKQQPSGDALNVGVSGTACDLYNLPDGEYTATISENDFGVSSAASALTVDGNQSPAEIASTSNGVGDLFFAKATGTWTASHRARNVGSINDWSGTNEVAALAGKNQLGDIFLGSTDSNILLLTDDAQGDSLFVDDIYSASPNELGSSQARLSQIQEIRAGLGNDIVDMTSQRFEYIGDGVTIRGGLGNDIIWANKGENYLFGDAGNDRLVGASGNDIIAGGSGNDSLHGGGGEDIFAFGKDWGQDTLEQLATGKVTLWFDKGSLDNWNADSLTYSDGDNSVQILGDAPAEVRLKFGNDDSRQYQDLLAAGAFDDFTSEKIFGDKNPGMLA